ncbi:hypothetical protein HD554DRAFT_2117571 [Boletus coccyginus]|nr:hypothetical protein HD554DRAFT_2117571 [Boletus coccyginus]
MSGSCDKYFPVLRWVPRSLNLWSSQVLLPTWITQTFVFCSPDNTRIVNGYWPISRLAAVTEREITDILDGGVAHEGTAFIFSMDEKSQHRVGLTCSLPKHTKDRILLAGSGPAGQCSGCVFISLRHPYTNISGVIRLSFDAQRTINPAETPRSDSVHPRRWGTCLFPCTWLHHTRPSGTLLRARCCDHARTVLVLGGVARLGGAVHALVTTEQETMRRPRLPSIYSNRDH